MLLQFLETGKVLYIMLAVSVLGILSKLLVNRRYARLVKQSENMGAAKDKYLRQWKVKFENTYRSNGGVNNIPVYVEKNLKQYRFMGIRLVRLERFNRLAASLLCLGGLTASFMTYWYTDNGKIVALYAASGLLLGGAMVLWETLCNTSGKAEQILLSIRDYFENTLVGRLETGQAMTPAMEAAGTGSAGAAEASGLEAAAAAVPEPQQRETAPEAMRRKEEAAGREQDEDFFRKRLERIAAGRRGGGGRKLTAEEEHLIEDIIQEYLYES